MSVVPMNCHYCRFYDSKNVLCKWDHTPAGNINSCRHWKMCVSMLNRYDIPVPQPYEQYWLEK